MTTKATTTTKTPNGLSNGEIERYSRQLIIERFGVESQVKLGGKSALVVGCGGLGCPTALYLSAAGIGRLGLVDADTIEISNIHRQIAHSAQCVGKNKARNLADRCRELNDLVKYDVHECAFDKSSALDLVEQYDLVLDCTDNVITRYLINDVCVLANKPLVSGSALKFEGQLTVYNHSNGPCYRCLYPTAPRPETVANCSDAGILGPIVGMIGSLQALEAIKILADVGNPLSGRMLIFDGLDFTTRVIKLRSRQVDSCVMCGEVVKSSGSVTREVIESTLARFDYNQFCGVNNYTDKSVSVRLLAPADRISCVDYHSRMTGRPHLLIDTRPKCQFQICSLPNSINIPFDEFEMNLDSAVQEVKERMKNMDSSDKTKSIFVVCRRGNDSQIVVDLLKKHLLASQDEKADADRVESIRDLIGGLQEWARSVDTNFPKY